MPLEDEGVPLTFLTYFTLTWTAMLISAGAGANYVSYRTHPSTTTTNLQKISNEFLYFAFQLKKKGATCKRSGILSFNNESEEAAHKRSFIFPRKQCLLCVLFYLERFKHFLNIQRYFVNVSLVLTCSHFFRSKL